MWDKTKCSVYQHKHRLSVLGLALGLGVAEALAMLLMGWTAAFAGSGIVLVRLLSTFYAGFAPTLLGGIIGALWGFVVGFIFGAIVAWIYNRVASGCEHKEVTKVDRTVPPEPKL